MKYILGTLAVVILLVLAIVLFSTTSNRGSTQEGVRRVDLTNYINTHSAVSWTEQGKVVGPEEHRQVRIAVSSSERRIEILKGYDQAVERSQTFPNTPESYDRFMRSLVEVGFSRQRDAERTDYRGICPLGKRFIYTLNSGKSDELFLWSTSCSRKEGTFGGNSGIVQKLFQHQIPDYNDFVRGVRP